jgi:heat shock protein HslJ
MVMVEGRVENRPIGENQREVPALIVERFLTAKPGQQCSPGGGPIVGKWNISVIGEQLVTADRPPFLELQEDGRVAGFSGCNRFGGSYIRTGSDLKFDRVNSTLMACREPAMGLERQVLKALSQVKSYKIMGDQLTMLGAEGEIVLRLKRQP